MIGGESSPSGVACPDGRQLMAFTRGQLPLEALESVAEHVSGCETCASALGVLQESDAVVRRLRDAPASSGVENEAACARLEERARVIPWTQRTVEATVSEGAAAFGGEGLPLPAPFAAYLLLEQLGQGGMGVVYKARQERLKRLVALKMIRAGIYAGSDERARFQREGEAIARLRHPQVVQIHEFGEHAGRLYFSMELLEGGTLASKLEGRLLPEREAAELIQTLAWGVQAAHQHGVVHRDLKPSNVLFAADGVMKITDFGLAKVLDSDNNDTVSDAIIGTPAYMAPEQAGGETRRIGPAADIYALGVILYEALTGQPPFRGESRYKTLELVRTQEPEPPSRRRPKLSRELEAICLKCLEKEPKDRYESAAALADDLQRWLEGRSTRVRPLRWHQRVYRMGRRHSGIVAAACLLAVMAGLFFLFSYFRDPQREIERIQARLRRGEAVTLIGDKGKPAWSRWELGKGLIDPLPDGTFSLSSTFAGGAALALLPDPQGSYRFSAEAHLERFGHRGSVGLCFALSEHSTTPGVQQCYCLLIFNDQEVLWPDPKEEPPRDPKTGQELPLRPKFCAADFAVRHSSKEGKGGGELLARHIALFPQALNTPNKERPWHSLAVEVRAKGFDLLWDSDPPVHVNRQKLLDALDWRKRRFPAGHPLFIAPELKPQFSPREVLGLYVYNARASFRNVRVEPLPQP
jgi:tRNA A-37 threonylcarbamoyl transferase component Bud32